MHPTSFKVFDLKKPPKFERKGDTVKIFQLEESSSFCRCGVEGVLGDHLPSLEQVHPQSQADGDVHGPETTRDRPTSG